ncbi:MAG TPA: hypothetical protein VHG89_06345 [Verrucomicrobiae bacterium]|nr:hypothetical protein [Verrucomicrobiae bacterium]
MKANRITLITALAVGGLLALGTALHADDSTNTPPAAPTPKSNSGGHVRGPNIDQIAKRLDLTDDQKPKVKTILDERNDKMRAVMQDKDASRDDKMAKMKTIREDTDTKMKAVLTADQFAKWQKMQPQPRQHRAPNDAPQN